ncbi:mercuric reductase [Pedobacter duraquae]|uniref:Pyruvate/2-oxoglutarate dehydrogenase complex dihydrolipoamide dehydrogenase (E3) component n=1 Tax=Pedobacter duraquae TaxID=425511 RepID=A0A4R6IPB2_9SPHI|nr:mercuric reductase [Pedobacter duraquae]TDO24093.1 pyruvate/2-oxoglutarate dehydrogenase complex dihydrolipoamide dehydrogenase (E3) component [Pedobacter duraquae]
MKEFDAIVIGAGQAGIPLAKKLAKSGMSVALIEKRFVGGTCINDGCTPTKALVASARMAYLAGTLSEELGVDIPSYKLNFERVMARKNKIVGQFRAGSIKGLEATENLTLIYGEAKFVSDKVVAINSSTGDVYELTAKYILINTGCSPTVTKIEGIHEIKYLTSTSILELDEVPEHLLIVGGGYIGLEFGQMFGRFGAKVTIIEHSDRLLPHEDEDVCGVMTDIFKEEGIEVITQSKVTKFEKYGADRIRVTFTTSDDVQTRMCTHVLLASGRSPQTGNLGLENTAVTADDAGFIKVDDYLQTAVPNVFALGDVKGGPAFTHISYNDHLIIADHLIHGKKESIKGRLVPYCMFTDPQIGRIGITEEQAIASGVAHLVAHIPMRNVARAIETGETRGFMKAVVDKNTGLILGATIIGEQGGEIMTVLQMAMMGNITYSQIRFAIFAHPLYAESLNNLFMSLDA